MKIAVVVVLLWLGCGLIGAGFFNAAFRAEYPNLYRDPGDAARGCGSSIVTMFFGPFSMIIYFIMSGFGESGWTLSCAPVK